MNVFSQHVEQGWPTNQHVRNVSGSDVVNDDCKTVVIETHKKDNERVDYVENATELVA